MSFRKSEPNVSTEDEDGSFNFSASIMTSTVENNVQPIVRGHGRSASHGGSSVGSQWWQLSGSRNPSSNMPPSIPPVLPLASALKKPGHRRVFSQGQIPEGQAVDKFSTVITQPASDGVHMKGHYRNSSKTNFILPPGHEERQNKRSSLHRSGSSVFRSDGDKPSNMSHRRQASRSDSLGFSFYGHSRQASRTDSIYTLRQGPMSNYRQRAISYLWTRRRRRRTLNDVGSTLKNKTTTNLPKLRIIVPNHCVPSGVSSADHPNSAYAINKISTTKYTIFSFLPKNLFEQFHRFANLYFLFIVILNWIPSINAFGKEITMIPVIFVLSVTAVKDIFEDRRRYLNDKLVNNSYARVYKPEFGRYTRIAWKNIRVGDIVHLSCNEQIPADILVLRSSDENGICFIDTLNLDGETNLKQRFVPSGLLRRNVLSHQFRGSVECLLPTTKIYRFSGSIIGSGDERINVDKDNLLLRECVLRNTTFVEGIVLYAGHESKSMLNNGGPKYKRSSVESKINLEVVWCIFVLFVLCFIGSFGSALWLNSFKTYVPFLNTWNIEQTNAIFEGFLSFWTFIILFQIIIPLSLYVSIELSKLSQVYLIHNDLHMYDPILDKRVECRALNIPEELGQIQYIFSDKTGTLTENVMVFKRCNINGIDFNHNSMTVASAENSFGRGLRPIIPVNASLVELLRFEYDIQGFVSRGKHSQDLDFEVNQTSSKAKEFFLLLAICNTVIVASHHSDVVNASDVIDPNDFNKLITDTTAAPPVQSHLTSLSPINSSDEASYSSVQDDDDESRRIQPPISFLNPLVKFVASSLLPSLSRASLSSVSTGRTSISNSVNDLKPNYEAESPDELALVDAAYAYNYRLIKRTPNFVQVSLPPGSALVEFEVLHILPFDSVRKRMSVIVRHPVSRERVLYCKGADSAMFPRLDPSTYVNSDDLLEKTRYHLDNYAKAGLRVLVMAKRILSEQEYEEWNAKHFEAESSVLRRDRLLSASYNRIETKLTLLGSTGVEDKLQEGVPNVIHSLRQAGIVVWVLTGDKEETAINIAYSCKLFSNDMEIVRLCARSRDAAESIIIKHMENRNSKRAMVVDGKTLVYILDKRAKLQLPFLRLSLCCGAVLCVRATPLQKAFIIRIVKKRLKRRTLAIGDGANDVSMIQTADVGIGISGQEGMQAVMASDFAISKFKYLQRLLLVHGHWNYDRLARMILYFFYKNASFVFVSFWYQLFCGFSGTVMIDQMYLMLYNLLFTSLPPFAIGIFDQDISSSLLQSNPALYEKGRLGLEYKRYSFWLNMSDALYQSLVIFFLPFGAYYDSTVSVSEFGTVICTMCVFVATAHLAIETKSWTIINWLFIFLSFLFFFGFALIYNGLCVDCFGSNSISFWVMQHTMGTLHFWILIIISSPLAVLPRVIVRANLNTLKPSLVTRALIEWKGQNFKDFKPVFSLSRMKRTKVSVNEEENQIHLYNRRLRRSVRCGTEMTVIQP